MLADVRYTLLEAVNEVQRKLGLSTSSLTSNKVATELVDHVNDVVSDLSDFGNWNECLVTANVTAHTSVRDYSITTSAVVKNVGDVYISTRRGPLRAVDIDTMRVMTRSSAIGQPTQYCVFGTDSIGNPNIRVRPTPDSTQEGAIFSILYYEKPPKYTTSDASTTIPFPARVLVLGVLAKYILRESGGAPTPQYQSYFQEYLEARKESLNRFRADTGWDVSFRPSRGNRWRR